MSFLSSRLTSHSLDKYRFTTPREVLEHYGAIQAQDIGQATWVIGSRIENSTEVMVRNACRDGSIVRTWPMRGTLHYMDPRNVKWMLDLCASKTLSGFPKRRAFLGISDIHAERALEIMDRELRGGKLLTRTELGKTLETHGIPMQTQWTYHLSCYAGTIGLICFWPPTDREETFVLTNEWIKESKSLNHDEQLAELALMYFRGHSPATIDDLAWWCGLEKTECRKAVNLIEKELEKIEYNGKVYYSTASHHGLISDASTSHSRHIEQSEISIQRNLDPSFHSGWRTWKLEDIETRSAWHTLRLIGGFDEYFLGYRDRSIVADIEHHSQLFTTNGIFFPLILQDGRVIGSWKREFRKDTIHFKVNILPWFTCNQKELNAECERYAKFWGYGKYEFVP